MHATYIYIGAYATPVVALKGAGHAESGGGRVQGSEDKGIGGGLSLIHSTDVGCVPGTKCFLRRDISGLGWASPFVGRVGTLVRARIGMNVCMS